MTRYLLIFFLCLSASAQTTLKGVHLYGKATFTGSPIVPTGTNLMRFWTYETMPLGITISNQWNDVISNAPLWQMDMSVTQPTNTALGVYFGGGTTRLTNDSIPSTGRSMWLVVRFANPADAPALVVSSGTTYYGANIETDSRFKYSGSPFRYLSSALASNTVFDAVLVSTPGPGGFNLYTNGVFSGTANDVSQFTADYVGNNAAGNHGLKGYIINYGWYTNALDTNAIAALHQWRTNRYGGSP